MSERHIMSAAVRWALGIFGILALNISMVSAQDADDADSEDSAEDIEEVLVTGSRIKRTNPLEATNPIVSIGEEQIELTGSVNVYDILNEIPQAGPAAISRASTNFSVGASGQQTIDLRGLGAGRTLTLVNGRRWVGGIPGTNIVDLNSIPSDLIERLEVSTGGASAVYGSDAIAGVVNVILKDDFEGVSLEAMTGAYDAGDGETNLYSLTAGASFAEDRGNAIINLRYDDQGGVMARDRAPNTGSDVFYYGWYYGAAYGAPYDSFIADPAYSSYPPQGRFFPSGNAGNSAGMLTFDCSSRNAYRVEASSTVTSWAASGGSDNCGFNRTYFRQIEIPIERKSAYSNITYDLTGDHELYAELSYITVGTQSALEPFPMSSEDVYGGDRNFGYHYTNPYVPAEIRDAAIAQNANNPDWNGHIPFIRRLEEVDNRGAANTRETFRVALGTRGSFGNIDYDWYYQYGKSERDQRSAGQFNALAFQQALDAEVGPTGQIQCASPTARAAGCVPINLFGIGSITPEMADWVRYRPTRQTTMEQEVLAGNITSSFSFAGRDISWAIGAEYRDERSTDRPDDLQQLGLHGGNRIPETNGEFDVVGVYAEVAIPLIQDVPLIEELVLEAAYRVDDYSTAGDVDASKVGLNWKLNDQFRVRGVYSQSVRAPTIDNLFAGQAQTFTAISDPCSGVGTQAEASMNPVIVANCLSIPTVAATAASGTLNPDTGVIEPGFFYTQPDTQTISGFVGGNPDLQEETADTYTFGIVWTPQYLPGLAVTLDYYEIEIEDVIGSVSATRLINECYTSADFPNAPQCNAHERFPDTGKLRYWYSYDINQSVYETTGFDVSANYFFDSLGFVPGTLNLNVLYTRRDEHKFQTTVESDPFDFVGEVGYNEDKFKLRVLYQLNNLTLSLDNTYYGSALDDVSQSPSDYHLNSISSMNYLDVQARYRLTDRFEIYGGIDNITDEDPPYCPTCNNEPGPGSHYSGLQYRIWDSMYWYAGIKFTL